MANLDYVMTDDQYYLDIVKSVDRYMIALNKPKNYESGESNYLNTLDKSFASLCVSMKEAGINDPKELSTFEFFETLEYFDRKRAVNNSR